MFGRKQMELNLSARVLSGCLSFPGSLRAVFCGLDALSLLAARILLYLRADFGGSILPEWLEVTEACKHSHLEPEENASGISAGSLPRNFLPGGAAGQPSRDVVKKHPFGGP